MCIAKVGQIVEREDGTLWALVDSGSYRASAWRQLNVSIEEKFPEKKVVVDLDSHTLMPLWEVRTDVRPDRMRVVGWVFDDTNVMLQLGDVNTPDMKRAKQQYDLEKLMIAVGERKK